MTKLAGKCFCGAVTWNATGEILWAALCHCRDCQRAASSDYASWFGVEKNRTEWQGPRKCYSSSSGVTRSYCEECGSPLSFETEILPDQTHLYAATLNNPELYKPTAHIFWPERLPWVQVRDELPKHKKGLQSAAKAGKAIL